MAHTEGQRNLKEEQRKNKYNTNYSTNRIKKRVFRERGRSGGQGSCLREGRPRAGHMPGEIGESELKLGLVMVSSGDGLGGRDDGRKGKATRGMDSGSSLAVESEGRSLGSLEGKSGAGNKRGDSGGKNERRWCPFFHPVHGRFLAVIFNGHMGYWLWGE